MADLIDPRQRQAAAILMSAIDLPAPAFDAARIFGHAARLCPGMTMDMNPIGDRHAQLKLASDLIGQMIAELDTAEPALAPTPGKAPDHG